MNNIGDYNTHDSTITSMIWQGSDLILKIEAPDFGEDMRIRNLCFTFKSVNSIKIDNEFGGKPEFELEDGEVFYLKPEGGGWLLYIEWVDYKNDVKILRKYEIDCGELDIQEEL